MTALQEHILASLRTFAADQHLAVRGERSIEYGVQILLADGGAEIPVNIYTTGRIVIGGKPGALRSLLQGWADTQQAAKPAAPTLRVEVAHIGVDEAGKGDVFGPLVIAGAVVQPEQSSLLQAQGVRDSKMLTSAQIQHLAAWLPGRCPVEVLVLPPMEYNQRYAELGNLNQLLGWGHGRVIETLHARTGVELALSDQFSQRPHIQQALDATGCPVRLEERPHAEADLAVAAASICARAAFERALEELRLKSGFHLPFGASDPAIPVILRKVRQRWGEDGLRRIAKLHFKPVKEILNPKGAAG